MSSRVTSLGAGILAVALLVAAPVPGEELVRPGMWEIVSTMTFASNPGKPPASRYNHCYKASDLAGVNQKSEALMTDSGAVPADQKCKVKDVKYSGNKGTWNLTCPDGVTIQSDMTFHGDSLEGVIQTGAGANAMTVHMSAKRTGDCR